MGLTIDGTKRLVTDEGQKLFAYDDETGERIRPGSFVKGWPTIGVGRNLATRGLTYNESVYLLSNDIDEISIELKQKLPWLEMGTARADVVIMVEFNTGDVFAFKEMLAAMEVEDWQEAAKQLLNSAAAKELHERYVSMAGALIVNHW